MVLAVPIPRTFVVGETETGSYLNTSVTNLANFLLNPPLAILTQTAVQTLTNGGFISIALDTSTIDTYGGHSNSTNNTRYTAQVAGWYEIQGTVSYTINGAGARQIGIAKNGVQISTSLTGVAASSSINTVVQTTQTVQMNAGDYVEIQGWQSSGGNLTLLSTQSGMSARWVHA